MLLLLALLLLTSCANPTSGLVAAARVNGQSIALDQYLRFVQINKSLCQLQNQLTGQITGPIEWNDPARRDDLAAVRRMSLEQLITAELTDEQAAAHHIQVDPGRVTELLTELQQQGALPPADLLPSLHIQVDDLRLLARQAVIQQTLLRLLPQVTTVEAQIGRIAVKSRATAEQVLGQVQQGMGFDTLAGQYSQDATRGTGGDAGTFVPGQAPPALDDAYFHAPLGTPVGPIAVQQPTGRLCFANAPGVEPAVRQPTGATVYYIVKVVTRDTVPLSLVPNAPNNAQNVAFTHWLRQGASVQVLVDF